jgi:beta-galactosidase
MRRTCFNDGWTFRAKGKRQMDMRPGTADWEPVTLPHDAMIRTERSPEAEAANAYFPGGVWEYQRTLRVAAEESESEIELEFEGVYRDALVFVNGTLAARRPYGYSNFRVPISQFLRYDNDKENEIRVEAQAGADSRWYSGAGIYRNVWLLTGPPVNLDPEGFQVRTVLVDEASATIEVAATIRNNSSKSPELRLGIEVLSPAGQVVAQSDTR